MFSIKFTLSFIFHCATAHLHKIVKTTFLINKKHYDVVCQGLSYQRSQE